MRLVTLIALIFTLGSQTIFHDRVSAREICFPDQPTITDCFPDQFTGYWENNGGLAVFGYPITKAGQERNPDLNVDLLTQWTERNRLEVHPENQPPFNILLGRMGADRLRQLGRESSPEGRESGPRKGCLWFETTGHNVCDQINNVGFKTYWQTHGLKVAGLDAYNQSLQLWGYPLTSPRMETNTSGDTVLTQWFERARFEWHPDKPDEFKVLLGLLGTEIHTKKAAPTPIGVGGVQLDRGQTPVAPRAAEANTEWIRYGSVEWALVEPKPGARNWAAMKQFESDMQALSARGLTPTVIVLNSPGWAQKVAGYGCGPIKPEALDSFAAFMRDLVSRYSGPPYNVKYWEIGNEPDAAYSLVNTDSGFGCWGDTTDPYYGGGYYAEMLKRVYPAMKQANSSAQLIVGGLLLDCDPTNAPAGKDCNASKFFEGILRNGGGNAFDIVGFHAYSYWTRDQVDWDQANPSWNKRGGAFFGKLHFLQDVQDQYNVHKPFLMNEGGLLCYPSANGCPAETFQGAQANYAIRLYTRTWANGLLGSVWYGLKGPGWRDGGLLDKAQQPRPAYHAINFLMNRLKGSSYAGQLSSGEREGYAFRKGATSYQIYWSNTSASGTIPLPEGTRAVYNKLGQPVATSGGAVRVGFEPIIIQIGG